MWLCIHVMPQATDISNKDNNTNNIVTAIIIIKGHSLRKAWLKPRNCLVT